jgi:uncharacterized protein
MYTMFKRKLYGNISAHATAKEYTILIGARQTGKSTLLRQLSDALKETHKTVVFLNLERKDILLELNQSPENIFKYCPLQDGQKAFVLIDEIQYLQAPSNFLKLLYDEYADRLKIIATGSSAFYIDRQFNDSLAGRKKIFELQTLDFEEFLQFKKQDILLTELINIRENGIQKSIYDTQLWMMLDEYANYGSYPSVVLEDNITAKIERLQDLRDSFVKRDILEAGITDETKFYRLMIILASQSGNLLNINELSNTLKLSNLVVENYLFVLQKCFHISLVKPYFNNIRKELTKMPKIYFNDLGLRNVLINYFSPIEQRSDKGVLLENLVYRRQVEINKRDSVKFWRTTDGNEVDFVIETSFQNGEAIEVKFNESDAKLSKYKKFTEAYPTFSLRFLSWRSMNLLK